MFATNSGDSISTRALEKSAALAPRSLRHHQTLRSVPGAWQGCLRTHVGVQGCVCVCVQSSAWGSRARFPCTPRLRSAGAAPVQALLLCRCCSCPRYRGEASWGAHSAVHHGDMAGLCAGDMLSREVGARGVQSGAPHPCLGTTAVLGGSLVRKAAAFGQLGPAAPSLLSSRTLKASSLPTFLPLLLGQAQCHTLQGEVGTFGTRPRWHCPARWHRRH